MLGVDQELTLWKKKEEEMHENTDSLDLKKERTKI